MFFGVTIGSAVRVWGEDVFVGKGLYAAVVLCRVMGTAVCFVAYYCAVHELAW